MQHAPENGPRRYSVSGNRFMKAPPTRIGRYQVHTPISVGGMAELFLASVSGPGGFRKFVALKRILPSLKHDEGFVAMFLEEARISASLSHANIAQVFELGESDGEYFLALELIEGHDLGRIVRKAAKAHERLPVWFAASVVRDICLALSHAHGYRSPGGRLLPVVHRDLKPNNVMVTYSGATKLIDFGIAKARGAASITRAGTVKGSASYMSPEQVRGEELDGRSDLFSAGEVLYELLTGVRAFKGDDEIATAHAIVHATPVPPAQLVASLPPALSELVMKAIQKDTAGRFQTAGEMAAALQAAVPDISNAEERRARWMQEQFAERMQLMRELLASSEGTDDHVAEAAGNLKPEVEGLHGSGDSQLAVHTPTSTANRSMVRTSTISVAPTALIVDDTRVGRFLVNSVLTSDGFRVIEAQSGTEALEMLEQLDPDVVVLDVMMPGIDGFETCERFRAMPNRRRRCPVIFLSAACSLEERAKGLAVGGDDFLRKPFEGSDLVTRVRAHLQRAAAMVTER